jgi:TPR repeat protein
MGAPMRERGDGKSSEAELKSETQSKYSDADLAGVKAVLDRLQRLSSRTLAGAEQSAEDDAARAQSSTPPEPGKPASTKNAPARDPSKDTGATPSSPATEELAPPWKRKSRREAFEGDVAVVELRSRLGRTERIPEPAVRFSSTPTFSGVVRLMSGVATAATVVGVAGYLWSFELSSKLPELTPASGQANIPPTPATPATSLAASNRDFDPQAAARTASIGLAPVGKQAHPVTSVDAAQRLALPTTLQTVSPSVVRRPPVAAEDAPVIAAKMKIGVELMTYGEVTAARMMFQRVAEAGEGAGAFALAETYDPLVLGGLRLREGIMPDLALARTWYERARELGSLEAQERLLRLAQLPQ